MKTHLFLLVFCMFAWSAAVGQDPLKVAPDKHKLLLENDKVRVYEVTLKPGEKIPMHSHPPYVVFFLDSAKIKTTTPDGKSSEREMKQGEVTWSDGVTHANENVGSVVGRAFIVEVKALMKKEEKMQK